MLRKSKKARMTAAGLGVIPAIVTVVAALLASMGVEPEVQEAVVTTLTWALGILFGAYNIGQGLADFGKERPQTRYELGPILEAQVGEMELKAGESDEGG